MCRPAAAGHHRPHHSGTHAHPAVATAVPPARGARAAATGSKTTRPCTAHSAARPASSSASRATAQAGCRINSLERFDHPVGRILRMSRALISETNFEPAHPEDSPYLELLMFRREDRTWASARARAPKFESLAADRRRVGRALRTSRALISDTTTRTGSSGGFALPTFTIGCPTGAAESAAVSLLE